MSLSPSRPEIYSTWEINSTFEVRLEQLFLGPFIYILLPYIDRNKEAKSQSSSRKRRSFNKSHSKNVIAFRVVGRLSSNRRAVCNPVFSECGHLDLSAPVKSSDELHEPYVVYFSSVLSFPCSISDLTLFSQVELSLYCVDLGFFFGHIILNLFGSNGILRQGRCLIPFNVYPSLELATPSLGCGEIAADDFTNEHKHSICSNIATNEDLLFHPPFNIFDDDEEDIASIISSSSASSTPSSPSSKSSIPSQAADCADKTSQENDTDAHTPKDVPTSVSLLRAFYETFVPQKSTKSSKNKSESQEPNDSLPNYPDRKGMSTRSSGSLSNRMRNMLTSRRKMKTEAESNLLLNIDNKEEFTTTYRHVIQSGDEGSCRCDDVSERSLQSSEGSASCDTSKITQNQDETTITTYFLSKSSNQKVKGNFSTMALHKMSQQRHFVEYFSDNEDCVLVSGPASLPCNSLSPTDLCKHNEVINSSDDEFDFKQNIKLKYMSLSQNGNHTRSIYAKEKSSRSFKRKTQVSTMQRRRKNVEHRKLTLDLMEFQSSMQHHIHDLTSNDDAAQTNLLHREQPSKCTSSSQRQLIHSWPDASKESSQQKRRGTKSRRNNQAQPFIILKSSSNKSSNAKTGQIDSAKHRLSVSDKHSQINIKKKNVVTIVGNGSQSVKGSPSTPTSKPTLRTYMTKSSEAKPANLLSRYYNSSSNYGGWVHIRSMGSLRRSTYRAINCYKLLDLYDRNALPLCSSATANEHSRARIQSKCEKYLTVALERFGFLSLCLPAFPAPVLYALEPHNLSNYHIHSEKPSTTQARQSKYHFNANLHHREWNPYSEDIREESLKRDFDRYKSSYLNDPMGYEWRTRVLNLLQAVLDNQCQGNVQHPLKVQPAQSETPTDKREATAPISHSHYDSLRLFQNHSFATHPEMSPIMKAEISKQEEVQLKPRLFNTESADSYSVHQALTSESQISGHCNEPSCYDSTVAYKNQFTENVPEISSEKSVSTSSLIRCNSNGSQPEDSLSMIDQALLQSRKDQLNRIVTKRTDDGVNKTEKNAASSSLSASLSSKWSGVPDRIMNVEKPLNTKIRENESAVPVQKAGFSLHRAFLAQSSTSKDQQPSKTDQSCISKQHSLRQNVWTDYGFHPHFYEFFQSDSERQSKDAFRQQTKMSYTCTFDSTEAAGTRLGLSKSNTSMNRFSISGSPVKDDELIQQSDIKSTSNASLMSASRQMTIGPYQGQLIKNANRLIVGKNNILSRSEFEAFLASSSLRSVLYEKQLALSLVSRSAIVPMSPEIKCILWKHRDLLRQRGQGLVKLVSAADAALPAARIPSALSHLFQTWPRLPIESVLELLSPLCQHPHARQFAVDTLRTIPDLQICCFMPQLIQAIRFDMAGPQSKLLDLLIDRASMSPLIASKLHWGLLCEFEDTEGGHLFIRGHQRLMDKLSGSCASSTSLHGWQVIELQKKLIRYLRCLSGQIRDRRDRADQKTQRLKTLLISRLSASVKESQDIKQINAGLPSTHPNFMTNLEDFNLLNLEIPIPLPVEPHHLLLGVIPEESFVVRSSQYPIVIACRVLIPKRKSCSESSDSYYASQTYGGSTQYKYDGIYYSSHHMTSTHDYHEAMSWWGQSTQKIIDSGQFEEAILKYLFKTGDDLRQDQLVTQLIGIMNKLLMDYGSDFCITEYHVCSLSPHDGLIEFVERSTSLSSIKKLCLSLRQYFSTAYKNVHSPLGFSHEVLDRFIKSCSAFSVITFLLGVGDRHLDNLMVTEDGRLFHVDFGFILGEDPKPFPPPMKLCGEIIDALGGIGSQGYTEFQLRCCQCFRCLRCHSKSIIDILLLMANSGIRSLKAYPIPVITRVQDKFQLNVTEAEAEAYLLDIVNISANALFPAVVDKFHEWTIYWK